MKIFESLKFLWSGYKTELLFVLFAGFVLGAILASL